MRKGIPDYYDSGDFCMVAPPPRSRQDQTSALDKTRGAALLGSRGHLAKSLECLRAHKCSLVTEEAFTVLWLARGYGFKEATEVRQVGTSTCAKRARLPPARKTTGTVVTSLKRGDRKLDSNPNFSFTSVEFWARLPPA